MRGPTASAMPWQPSSLKCLCRILISKGSFQKMILTFFPKKPHLSSPHQTYFGSHFIPLKGKGFLRQMFYDPEGFLFAFHFSNSTALLSTPQPGLASAMEVVLIPHSYSKAPWCLSPWTNIFYHHVFFKGNKQVERVAPLSVHSLLVRALYHWAPYPSLLTLSTLKQVLTKLLRMTLNSLCSPAGLELAMLLPLPSKSWDYGPMLATSF